MPKRQCPEAFTLHAGFTGARAGDRLEGHGDAADLVLEVVAGVVWGVDCYAAEHDPELVIEAAIHLLRCTPPDARRAVADFPIMPGGPNHLPIGSGCAHDVCDGCACPAAATFVVLSQGRLQHWAELHGHGDELSDIVLTRRPVTWRDLLRLVHTPGRPGGKTLVLRCYNFCRLVGPLRLAEDDPRLGGAIGAALDDRHPPGPAYLLDRHVVRLPESGTRVRCIVELAREALPDVPERVLADVEDVLGSLSPGALKSLLQKTIRFHAERARLPADSTPRLTPDGTVDASDIVVETRIVSVVALLLLFQSRGSFSPELQLFTRGCTAALKRLAVILVEDAWVPGSAASVRALLALALATQRLPDYWPSNATIVAACRLAAGASDSAFLIAWRAAAAPVAATDPIAPADAAALTDAAALLRVVGSFGCDMDMMDEVAAMARRGGPLPLRVAAARPAEMPIEHMVDQHAFRGIGHALAAGGSFAERFATVFGLCTGANPRLAPPPTEAEVAGIRFAQRCCARFALALPTMSAAPAPGRFTAQLALDPGVLSAGVGPIAVRVGRRSLLVLLGLVDPADAIVMLPPARTPRDLFVGVTPVERSQAIAQAEAAAHPVSSPLISGVARFADGQWLLDDRPWGEVCAAGLVVDAPLVAAPAVDLSDEAVAEALGAVGEGMAVGAREAVAALVAGCAPRVVRRAASLLQQEWRRVAMPTPDLRGRLASDQLAAYAGDWDVWRLLVALSRLAPGALRPEAPPNFAVPDARLLRVLEQWLAELPGRVDGAANPWPADAAWASAAAGMRLMEHQRAAVAAMVAADGRRSGGHFLVMDTGLGKTVTALAYAYDWLCRQPGDHVQYVLWLTPRGTVDNLVEQLRDTWHVPVWLVPRVSAARSPPPGSATRLVLRAMGVNVLHADHARTALDELVGLASRCLVIVDEVDEFYANTLRTSAALQLVRLCPKFVAQTATPMRRNESELLAWLADTCAFPVEPRNMLVAASSMVSTQLELGIRAEERLVLVPMVDAVRRAFRALAESRSWATMAREVQRHTDDALAAEAVRAAAADRAVHPAGGALLVADSQAHAERLLGLCRALGATAGGFACMQEPDAGRYAVVVVPKSMDRGYNSAVRLGALVTGVYAGNAAARHQVRGRLRRIGQVRAEVVYTTVVMQHSILELLHERHGRVDSLNLTLEQLGERYAADLALLLK